MKTIREAINRGAKIVYCNSGLSFELPDMWGSAYQAISPPKMIQGKPVFRWVFISLYGEDNPKANSSSIKHRSMFTDDGFCYFRENDYVAREREVNELISDNGGIDIYRTSYWINGWDY